MNSNQVPPCLVISVNLWRLHMIEDILVVGDLVGLFLWTYVFLPFVFF